MSDHPMDSPASSSSPREGSDVPRVDIATTLLESIASSTESDIVALYLKEAQTRTCGKLLQCRKSLLQHTLESQAYCDVLEKDVTKYSTLLVQARSDLDDILADLSGVKQLLRQHFPEAFAQAQAQAQAQAHEGQARAVSDSL